MQALNIVVRAQYRGDGALSTAVAGCCSSARYAAGSFCVFNIYACRSSGDFFPVPATWVPLYNEFHIRTRPLLPGFNLVENWGYGNVKYGKHFFRGSIEP